jgi:hypothetical protein
MGCESLMVASSCGFCAPASTSTTTFHSIHSVLTNTAQGRESGIAHQFLRNDAPPPPPGTNRTRRVLHPVLIGHAASGGVHVVSCALQRVQAQAVRRECKRPPRRETVARRSISSQEGEVFVLLALSVGPLVEE